MAGLAAGGVVALLFIGVGTVLDGRVPHGVMMGFALPDSNLHAPDENLHLPTFFRGIRTSLHFLREMAERGAS